MKKILFAAVAVCGLTLSGVALRAADEKKADKGSSFHGVLIDNACGEKKKTEADAAKHPKSCAVKSSCAESGYQLVAGSDHLKFDDNGNKLAKEYLEKNDSTKVTVEGTKDGDNLKVTSIKAADAKADKSEKAAK
jgi:hypothetical protein